MDGTAGKFQARVGSIKTFDEMELAANAIGEQVQAKALLPADSRLARVASA